MQQVKGDVHLSVPSNINIDDPEVSELSVYTKREDLNDDVLTALPMSVANKLSTTAWWSHSGSVASSCHIF
jgi:hypothetical protein